MRGAAASLLNANAFDSRSHAPTVAGADRDRDRDRDWDTDADTGTARDRHTARMRLTERWGGLGLRPQRPLPAVWSGYGGSNLESRGKGQSQSRPLGLLGLIPMGEISDDHRSGHCEKDRAKSEVQVAGMVDVGHISTRD